MLVHDIYSFKSISLIIIVSLFFLSSCNEPYTADNKLLDNPTRFLDESTIGYWIDVPESISNNKHNFKIDLQKVEISDGDTPYEIYSKIFEKYEIEQVINDHKVTLEQIVGPFKAITIRSTRDNNPKYTKSADEFKAKMERLELSFPNYSLSKRKYEVYSALNETLEQIYKMDQQDHELAQELGRTPAFLDQRPDGSLVQYAGANEYMAIKGKTELVFTAHKFNTSGFFRSDYILQYFTRGEDGTEGNVFYHFISKERFGDWIKWTADKQKPDTLWKERKFKYRTELEAFASNVFNELGFISTVISVSEVTREDITFINANNRIIKKHSKK